MTPAPPAPPATPVSPALSPSPADALVRAVEAAGSPACVGLDPVWGSIPPVVREAASSETDALERFCLGVLDAVAGTVGVVKPQSACFERYGSAGYAVLERVIARAKDKGLIVVLDAKRADIDASAEHYAAGARSIGADWITVSPYMGPSSIEPFLNAGLGVFALCRTSNPDSDRLQSLDAGGMTLAEHTAGMIEEMGRARRGASGFSDLGAVVGATKSARNGAALRGRMPDQILLVPGVGAQGGAVENIKPLLRAGATGPATLGVLVNASRSVLFPPRDTKGAGTAWPEAVRDAARAFSLSLSALSPARQARI